MCVVRSCPRDRVRVSVVDVELLTELHEHIRNLLSVVRVGASFVLPCVLASGVDGGRASKSTEVTQYACLRCCVFFLGFDRACLFLDHVACVLLYVSVSIWWYVSFRFCTSRRSGSSWSLIVIVLSWKCHGLFELRAELLQCRLVGRRVGVGRDEGLFLVCLINVDRVLTPIDSAVIGSSLLLCFLFR